MTTIDTITELLNKSQCQYRIYDISRKIDKISKENFEKLENNQLPHATPLQGHAHLAISFWQKNSPTPYLWFVKLPLDERSLFNQAARNHFIAIIVEALGTDLSVDPTERQEELLKSNPYIFTPSQYKLAMLNSLMTYELKQPASQFYPSVVDYFTNGDWSQWHQLGAQGITDFAVRIDQDNNLTKVCTSIKHLPINVLSPLCGALENINLPVTLLESCIAHFHQTLENERKQLLLRAMASSCHHPFAIQLFDSLLEQDELDADIIIVIAGRCWTLLADPKRCLAFLEKTIAVDKTLFPAIFRDLVAIPAIRPYLFECMRDTQRSESLAKAIGTLFN